SSTGPPSDAPSSSTTLRVATLAMRATTRAARRERSRGGASGPSHSDSENCASRDRRWSGGSRAPGAELGPPHGAERFTRTAAGTTTARRQQESRHMSETRSPKVRRVLHLESRGAALLARYEAAMVPIAATRHRAQQVLQRAKAIKATLTPAEVSELRRARSGVGCGGRPRPRSGRRAGIGGAPPSP